MRHATFVYKQNDLFGSIGINEFDCNTPRFKSIGALAGYVGRELERIGYPCSKYMLVDISEFDKDFITNMDDMSHFIDISRFEEIELGR